MSQGYPTLEQVRAAGDADLMRWVRFLPSPTDENRPVMDLIVQRYKQRKHDDPGSMVAASKQVGL